MDTLPLPPTQVTPTPPVPGVVVCPLCHTALPRLATPTAPGESIQCPRCLQSWSTQRLETVAAYQRLTF